MIKNFCFFLLVAFSDLYEPAVSEAQRVGTFGKLSVKAPRRSIARPKADLPAGRQG